MTGCLVPRTNWVNDACLRCREDVVYHAICPHTGASVCPGLCDDCEGRRWATFAHTAPRRIQRKRTKGWRMPEGVIYVGRPTKFGNPFAPQIIPGWATLSRQYAVDDFTRWLNAGPGSWTMGAFKSMEESDAARDRLLAGLPDLRGRDLACWCPVGQPCHADILLGMANEEFAA